MNYRLIDTHAHLDFEAFQENIDEILEKARSVGVEKIIVPGVTFDDSEKIINLIEKYDNLYGALAVHPSEVKNWNEDYYDLLKDYAQHEKIIAIGETGLDYYWDKTFIDTQKHVFRRHLELAEELNLPVIVHNRDAHADTLEILKEYSQVERMSEESFQRSKAPLQPSSLPLRKGVMHCFSGSAEFALDCIKIGYYIALGGPVTFKNAKKPKEVAQKIPLEYLLLETDSPFLTPHPHRGEQNDPSQIILIAETIADIRGLSVEEIANITSNNAERLFFQ